MNNKLTQFKCLVTTFLLVAAMVMPSTAQAKTITPVQPVGEGTASIPYLIFTAEELYWFAGLVNGDASVCINEISQNRNAWAVLESNITVNSGVLKADGTLADDVRSFAQWTPIGNENFRYTGNFDGQGHTISGLYFNNNTGSSNVGLFGYIDKSYDANASCTIQNVGIVDSYFNGYSCVGSVCGCSYFGTISNCYNTGTVIATDYHSGGICGLSNYSSIEKCYNTGSVEGYTIVGGVAGQCMYGSITNCYNTGSVKGVGTASAGVGGVCETAIGSEVTNCYNIGTLSGQTVGNVINSSCKTLTNSYYLADGETDEREGTTAMSADQFANGEVAYLLNNGMTDGSQAWYQTLSGSGEGYPNLNKDAKNRTVYAGYRHSETTPYCSNTQSNIPSDYGHLHAYNSDATDEANGNHNMSYVQDENNQYTWTDNEANSNATAQCNFICSVCNSEVSKDMTVTYNEEKPNVPAKCREKGYNYYVASLTFNGTTYTNNYTQEVPDLGHDDSGDVTFNSGNIIYEKYCNRDGCGVLVGYYATSDGSVKAIEDPEGVFTANDLTLQDARTYDNQAVFTATKFTYNRTFSNTNWTTWYVPFELTLTAEICAKYDFSRINNVHQYDDDGDGNADRTVVESFRQTAGVKLKANYPYLVRAKSNADFSMSLPLTNVVPALAETNSIDCQSVDYKYTFTGTYAGMGDSGSADTDPYTLCDGNKWLHFYSLSPMRHYLTIESRNVSSPSTAPMRSIMLSVVGDEDTTGIVKLYDEERKSSETYDLSGRRLPAGSKPRGLIIENGKVTFKK